MAITPMTLTQMVDAIGTRVDDVIDINTACEWLNAGQNQLAIAVGASFPQLSASNANGSFAFDAKWQELPILYACALFKGKETSLTEKNAFMSQFVMGLKDFAVKYDLSPWLRDDDESQQFTATAGQTNFLITKISYDNATGDLKVYKYDPVLGYAIKLQETSDWYANIDPTQNDFTLVVACVGGETITAVWEVHADIQEPPYSFWGW